MSSTRTYQLGWWILGFGDEIEVLEPIELRREIAETLSAASKNICFNIEPIMITASWKLI
ncbi:MAG: WYL domain-containing protein [Methylotenera sp.]|nr:WYL domain-containing protein [Methylotenera sp.]